jgi:hypothetical protein
MLRSILRAAAALSFLAAFSPLAWAEHWLVVTPKDPFSKDGSFHQFDVDTVFQDKATGYIASRMIYEKPRADGSPAAPSWWVWAFDCKGNTVFYVSSPKDGGGIETKADWRKNPESLAKPVMGDVTNIFGRKVCALKGSWPKGDLP